MQAQQFDLHSLLSYASALQDSGYLREAADIYRKILDVDAKNTHSLNAIAIFEAESGNLNEAFNLLSRAIKANPKDEVSYLNRSNILSAFGRHEEAIVDCNKAIKRKPKLAEAFNNRGIALKELRRFDEALRDFEKAISLEPKLSGAYCNRGNIYLALRKFENAFRDYERAISLNESDPSFYLCRGNAYLEIRNFDQAVADYERALQMRPDYSDALFSLSIIQLLQNLSNQSLRGYEARSFLKGAGQNKKTHKPMLESLVIKPESKILVRAEQGFGDTIQFCRYIPLMIHRGFKIFFEPQKKLQELISHSLSDVKIVDLNDENYEYDYHVPLLSLPFLFETDINTVPAQTPYLRAHEDRIGKWSKRLGAEGLKIGICWQGSESLIDSGRSFSVRLFEHISKLKNIRLISLHKGAGEVQLKKLPPEMKIETLGPDFDEGDQAFLDTAAVMMSLDLIITSDTAVAHLAGALGRPVWTVLKYVPDWRWMLDRSDSPWYPKMRLFRQEILDDWSHPFQAMERELTKRMGL